MATYTPVNMPVLKEILDLYGIDGVQEFSPLSNGISNSNYIVRTNKSSVLLKICNDKSVKELEDEVNILLSLKDSKFNFVIPPIPTTDEKYIFKTDKLHGSIFPFVEADLQKEFLNNSEVKYIGKTLALLHQVSLQDNLNQKKEIRDYSNIGIDAQYLKDYITNDQCPNDFKDTFNELLNDNIDQYINFNHKTGLIHGDLYSDNVLFRNNQLYSIVDFEQSGMGNLLLDIGISISGVCLDDNKRISLNLIQSFLKGYHKYRNLTEDEMKLIKPSIVLGLFSIARWRISRFDEKNISEEMKNSYKELLRRAKNFSEDFKDINLMKF